MQALSVFWLLFPGWKMEQSTDEVGSVWNLGVFKMFLKSLSSRVLCRERVNVLLGLVLHPFATSAINGPVSIEPYMLANTTPEWHRFACHVICPMMLHNVISCHIISYQYHIYYTFFRRTWHAKVQEVLEFWGPLNLRQAIGGSWAFSKAGELLCARVRGALFEALLRQDWRNLPQWTITVAVASNTPKKKQIHIAVNECIKCRLVFFA